jgi:hypothetical protein
VAAVVAAPASGAQAAAPQPETVAAPSAEAIAQAAQDAIAAAEAAMAKSVSAALLAVAASQNSLASLMTHLVQAQQTPSLPQPVLAAIAQVLTLRTPIDAELTAGDIKAALTNSGLLTESNAVANARGAMRDAQTPPSGTDIKSAIVALQQVLKTWLAGGSASPSAVDGTPKASQPLAGPPAPSPPPASSPPQSLPDKGSSVALPKPPLLVSAATVFPMVDQEAGVNTAQADPQRPPPQIPVSTQEPRDPAPDLAAGAPVANKMDAAVSANGIKVLSAQTQPIISSNLPQPSLLQSAAQPPASPAPDAVRIPAPPQPPATVLAAPATPARVPTASPPFAASVTKATVLEVPNAPPTANAVPRAPMEPGAQTISPKAAIAAPQTGGSGAQPPVPSLAAAQVTTTQAPVPAADIKSALLVLQQDSKPSLTDPPAQLYTRTGTTTPRAPTTGAQPPSRGAPAIATALQRVSPPSLSPDATPRAVGEILAKRADAVLSHMKLLQIVSLPDAPPSTQAANNPNSGPRWMFEMPFAMPQGSMVAHFQIDRDSNGGSGEQSGPVWRARFSLEVEPLGPVHAQVALVGERAWVTLWAEREDGVQALRAKEALLSQSLQDSDFVAEIAFCLGAPRRRVAAAGQLVDSSS